LLSALHLKEFSGHGNADGDISVNGSLTQPQSIIVDANLSRLAMNYENVRLENAGPGSLSFDERQSGDRPGNAARNRHQSADFGLSAVRRAPTVGLRLNGALDLRLITGFVPNLDARGPAQSTLLSKGTLDRPRITGRVHIETPPPAPADFPTGLRRHPGRRVFDATRCISRT